MQRGPQIKYNLENLYNFFKQNNDNTGNIRLWKPENNLFSDNTRKRRTDNRKKKKTRNQNSKWKKEKEKKWLSLHINLLSYCRNHSLRFYSNSKKKGGQTSCYSSFKVHWGTFSCMIQSIPLLWFPKCPSRTLFVGTSKTLYNLHSV